MAAVSVGKAHWEGSLLDGSGATSLATSDLGTFRVSWKARTEGTGGQGQTSPEELIAAAHASCFSMALSAGLGKAGHTPVSLDTQADVTFSQVEGGWGITAIALSVRGIVPGLTAEQFAEFAEGAKAGCPVSKALAGVPQITVAPELVA